MDTDKKGISPQSKERRFFTTEAQRHRFGTEANEENEGTETSMGLTIQPSAVGAAYL
jgi:hypothetical protein